MNTIQAKIELKIPQLRESSNVCKDIVNGFGLSSDGWTENLLDLKVPSSGIVLVTGASGLGKSLLLDTIAKSFSSIRKIEKNFDENIPVVDVISSSDAGEAIRYLSKFGLGEPRIMVAPFSQLSDGQKDRFLLALSLKKGYGPLFIDEFTTKLDRQTAKVIAINLGKILRSDNQTAYIAGCNDDVLNYLKPDVHIMLDTNGNHKVLHLEWEQNDPVELLNIEIRSGSIDDYKKLARYHYENDNASDIDMLEPMVDQVVSAYCEGELIGVNLCTKPWPDEFNRFSVFSEINKKAIQSFRVIVHPRYRGIGLTKALDVIPKKHTTTLLTWSVFSKHYSFPILSNYKKVNSPFEEMSEAEVILQEFVESRRKCNYQPLHLIKTCRDIWDGLDENQKKYFRKIIITAATEKCSRLAIFQLDACGIQHDIGTEKFIMNFFSNLYSKSSFYVAPAILAETVYRPMAMFVKHVNQHDCIEGGRLV